MYVQVEINDFRGWFELLGFWIFVSICSTIMSKSYPYLLCPILLGILACLSSCIVHKNLRTQHQGKPNFDFMGDTIEDWSLVRKDSLWGYVSADGKQLIEPRFQWADTFKEGMALVKCAEGYQYIKHNGRMLGRQKFPHAYPFSQGLAAVEVNGKWGYINQQGKFVIDAQFDWAEPFHAQRAVVSKGLKKGFIDEKGQFVIPLIYEEAFAFKNGVARVRYKGKWRLIDPKGKNKLDRDYDGIRIWENQFYYLSSKPLSPQDSWFAGLTDVKGNLILDSSYTEIRMLNKQYIGVKKAGLVGLHDLQGNVLIPLGYAKTLLEVSEDGLVTALKNGKFGFMNVKGVLVYPYVFDQVLNIFAEGRRWVEKNKIRMLLDRDFQLVNSFPRYADVYSFNNAYAVVGIEDRISQVSTPWRDNLADLYGYIDTLGNEVVPPQYPIAESVNRYGVAPVGNWDEGVLQMHLINMQGEDLSEGERYADLKAFGSELFYDTQGSFFSGSTGKKILDFPYENIRVIQPDMAFAYKDGKVGLIDSSLNELIPVDFDEISQWVHLDRRLVNKAGLWGFVDEKYRIRIPLIYEEIHFNYPNEVAIVKKEGRVGVIDKNGQVRIPLKYDDVYFFLEDGYIQAKYDGNIDRYSIEGRLLP